MEPISYEDFLSKFLFSIYIYRNCKVVSFKKRLKLSLRGIMRPFSQLLETFLEIETITKNVGKYNKCPLKLFQLSYY